MKTRVKLTALLMFGFLLENATTGLAASDESTSGWKPLIDQGLLEPLMLLVTLLAVGMFSWLVFYVEVHRDDPLREKVLGIVWRMLLTGILVGLALDLWFIIQPIPFRY